MNSKLLVSAFDLLLKVFSPIPKNFKRGWEVLYVEGNATITDSGGVQHTGTIDNLVLNFLILSSKFGQLVYGLLANAWDQWAFFEGTSGDEPSGVWIVLVTYFNNTPHIGVIQEKRPLITGKVFAVPHGFIDPGERGHEAALRELLEETGIEAKRIVSTGFFGFNTAFFGGSTNGGHSEEAFLVTITGEPTSIKVGPREADLTWMPVLEFISSSFCGPSIVAVSKALVAIQNETNIYQTKRSQYES